MRRVCESLGAVTVLAVTIGGCRGGLEPSPTLPLESSAPSGTATADDPLDSAPSREPSPTPTKPAVGSGSNLWSDGQILQLPLDLEFSFPVSLVSLPSGSYLLDEDDPFGITASSIGNSFSEQILAYSGNLRGWHAAGLAKGFMLVAEVREPAIYVVNLHRQTVAKLGQICDGGQGSLSADGMYYGRLCQPGGGNGSALELVRLGTGLARQLSIPSAAWEVGSRQIHWAGGERLFVDIGSDGEPCEVWVEASQVDCSNVFGPDQIRGVSPSGNWIMALSLEPRSSFIRKVYPAQCFDDASSCEAVLTIDDASSQLQWSPDANKLAVLVGSGLGSDEVGLGYYVVGEWTHQSLASFEGDYLLTAWCPDSDCILIEPTKPTTKPSVLVYLDGRALQMPAASPIGLIDIP